MYQFAHVSQETYDSLPYGAANVSEIPLPSRSTKDSAGYDFFMPYDAVIEPGERVVIKTGIRAIIPHGTFLALVPKSGLSFLCGTRLLNTIGVVDADYAQSDNEGHILVGLEVSKRLELKKGQKFVQGILLPYLTLDGENTPTEVRNGGFGSTGK